MLRAVIDTNILISARPSLASTSNAAIHAIDTGAFSILASVPLLMEYEAVLMRPERLLMFGLSGEAVTGFLNYLAGLIEPVKLYYFWRPQLTDVADEMVLETAING